MIHTTLARLREAGACTKGYPKLASYLGGISAYGRDTPIPLTVVLDSNGFDDVLLCLRATIEDSAQFARLLACDYAEHVVRLTTDPRPARTIAVARRYANGRATEAELEDAAYASAMAGDAAYAVAKEVAKAAGVDPADCTEMAPAYAAYSAARAAMAPDAVGWSARDAAYKAEWAVDALDTSGAVAGTEWSAAVEAERTWQTDRLRTALEATA